MPTLGGTLDTLRAAQASLGGALREQRWTDALTACNEVSSALVSLHAHLDGMSDDSRHDYVTDAYNAAVEQHNAAIDAIADAGELPGWRIGDVQACGCPVEPVAVPCDRHEAEWGQAFTDCGDCRYGVPGVRHYAHGCEAGQ